MLWHDNCSGAGHDSGAPPRTRLAVGGAKIAICTEAKSAFERVRREGMLAIREARFWRSLRREEKEARRGGSCGTCRPSGS